jgi:transposase
LGLCPDNRISGDKLLGKGTRHVVNRAATALRLAARNLIRSRSYLGAQYRRLRTKLGAPKAITAMAHRLARLVYRMLKYGSTVNDTSTRGLSTTRTDTANSKSTYFKRKRPNSANSASRSR